MKNRILILFAILCCSFINASAKFVQEIELKDGTVLSGYAYRQAPGKFIVFHVDLVNNDPQNIYKKINERYILQWRDVKAIRRSDLSSPSWCYDCVTLTNGQTYEGQIVEQLPGRSMDIVCKDSGKRVTVKNTDLLSVEKKVEGEGFANGLWQDRQYTNLIKRTDDTWQEGLIVLQYYDIDADNSYIELLIAGGRRFRIYMPDIKEYMIKLAE